MKRTLALAWLVLAAATAHAQERADDDEAETETDEDDTDGWTALPVIAYAPETGFLAAAYGLYYFRPEDAPEDAPTSQIAGAAGYSSHRQAGVLVEPILYFDEQRYRARALFEWYYRPTDYFGVGNDTHLASREPYDQAKLSLTVELSRRIVPSLHLGVRQDAERVVIDDVAEDGMLANQRVSGAAGGWISGAGLFARYDSRDTTFDAREGAYANISVTHYARALGSTFAFTSFELDVRKYQRIFGDHGVAVRLVGEALTGVVPFFAMAELGGRNLLRGVYGGRFRDRTMLAIEAEYRFPIWWRFGGVVFGGFGEVAPSPAALVDQRPHPAAGAGVRFSIDRDERVNARLDVGFSEDDYGIYFMVGEAF